MYLIKLECRRWITFHLYREIGILIYIEEDEKLSHRLLQAHKTNLTITRSIVKKVIKITSFMQNIKTFNSGRVLWTVNNNWRTRSSGGFKWCGRFVDFFFQICNTWPSNFSARSTSLNFAEVTAV